MKLILHIGQPKAGSTALQDILRRNMLKLEEQGVLYPLPKGGGLSHRHLAGLFFDPESWPRFTKHLEKKEPGSVKKKAYETLEKISSAVDKKSGVDTIVVSAESFFKVLNETNEKLIRKHLLHLFDEVHIAAYIRDPASRYLSKCLQALRHSSRLPKITPPNFRKVLESYLRIPGVHIHVRALDRDKLVGGDIVQDFFSTYLPHVETNTLDLESQPANEQFSPEIGSLLQEYRKLYLSNKDNVVDSRANRLRENLMAASEELGLTRRGKLKEEVHKAVAFVSREEVSWLADTFGVELNLGVDVHELSPSIPKVRLIDDVCDIDKVARKRLVWSLIIRNGGLKS